MSADIQIKLNEYNLEVPSLKLTLDHIRRSL
jgi:hypothetical protein